MSTFGMSLRVTTDSKQGGRKYMEDCLSVKIKKSVDGRNVEYTYLGVFDGHGGVHAAQFAKEHLLDEITKQKGFWSSDDNQILKAIKDGFLATHQQMWKIVDTWPRTLSGHPSTAGTTASVVFLRNGRLYVGHVGDSSVVIGRRKESMRSNLTADMITVDHKPESKKELERIETSGGAVVAKSGVQRVVWNRPRTSHQGVIRRSTPIDKIPFLAIARALGDLWSYNTERDLFVVSPDPDVNMYTLDVQEIRCIVLASDGLWNMVRPQEAVDLVDRLDDKSRDAYSGVKPASRLVYLALDRWADRNLRADNTSVIVCFLDPPDRQELPLSKQSSRSSSLPTVRLSSDSEASLSDADCSSDDISMECDDDGNMSHLHMGTPGFPKIMYPSPHVLKDLGQPNSPDDDTVASQQLNYPRVITGSAERFKLERTEKMTGSPFKIKTPRSAPPKLKRLNCRKRRSNTEYVSGGPVRKAKAPCQTHKFTMAQMRKRIAMSVGQKPSNLSDYISHSHNLRVRTSPQNATDDSQPGCSKSSQDLCVAQNTSYDIASGIKGAYKTDSPKNQPRTPSRNEREGNRSPKQAVSAKSPLRINPISADTPAMISPLWLCSVEDEVGLGSQRSIPGALDNTEGVLAEKCTYKGSAVRSFTSLFGDQGSHGPPSVSPTTRAGVRNKRVQPVQQKASCSHKHRCVNKVCDKVPANGTFSRLPRLYGKAKLLLL